MSQASGSNAAAGGNVTANQNVPLAIPPITRMPARGHSTAPTFDGDALNLAPFFDEVETLANEAQLDDAAKVKHTLRYARREDSELWRTLPTATGGTFAQFRAAVIALYPGAEDDRRYSESDLRRLVINQQTYGIENRAELGAYYREFLRISEFLVKKGRMSSIERDKMYMEGFDTPLRERVKTRLEVRDPTHYPDDPYAMQVFHDCAHFLLARTAAGSTVGNVSQTRPVPSATTTTTTTTSAPPVKVEQMESYLQNMMRDLTSKIMDTVDIKFQALSHGHSHSHSRSPPATTSTYAQQPAATTTTTTTQATSDQLCYFCGSPLHGTRDCPTSHDYVTQGLCKRNDNKRIILPTGADIPRWIAGRYLKDRVDNWHKHMAEARPARDTPPHMSSNLFEIVESYQAVISEDPAESDEDESVVQAMQAALDQRKKKVRFDGVHVPPRPKGKAPDTAPSGPTPKAVPPTPVTAQPVQPTPTSSKPSTPVPSPPVKTTPTSPSGPPKPSSAPTSMPQYKYTCPLDSPGATNDVINRILDTPIAVKTRELLAMSPESRRVMKELSTTRRTTTGTAEVGLLDMAQEVEEPVEEVLAFHRIGDTKADQEEWIVAEDSLPLRSVFPVLEGKLTCECVIDGGSQIIAMKEDIWRKLGLNLQPDEAVRMEAANSQVTSGCGRLQNVLFTFGDLNIYLQVQVMPNAPYDVLLGRPFAAVTSCITKDSPNGDQTITITDPNSYKRAMIPTYPRVRPMYRDPDF